MRKLLVLFLCVLLFDKLFVAPVYAQKNQAQQYDIAKNDLEEDDLEEEEFDEEDIEDLKMIVDKEPPQVFFTPIVRAVPGEKMIVKGRITDNRGILNAELFYQILGSNDISAGIPLALVDEAKSIYQASITVPQNNFRYYVEAVDTDNNGPMRAGPFLVVVNGDITKQKKDIPIPGHIKLEDPGTNYSVLIALIAAIIGLIGVVIFLIIRQKKDQDGS